MRLVTKRVVTEVEPFAGSDGSTVRVFRVERVEPENWSPRIWFDPEDVWVWFDGKARCCSCQGLVVAMRTDCAHARAVKRYVSKE